MSLDVTTLEKNIKEQHNQQPFSGVILIQQAAKMVLAQSYGFANQAEAISNTLATRFGIASGAKIFTAVAVCQLVEQGLLTFDTRLADCLSISFPHFDSSINIHQLLTHSAGIPDYFDEAEMDDFEILWEARPMYSLRQPRDFLPMFQTLPMKFAPGTSWAYNNAGFIVLGLVVEQVSGMSFTDYVQQNIFNRCDMRDSGYFLMDQLPARTAYGYIPTEDGQWRTNFYAVPVKGGPDGGVYTTVGDMAKFWDSLLAYRLLGEPATQAMLTPHQATDRADNYYGYGVWINCKDGAVSAYYIVGEDPGVAFFSGVYPAQDLRPTIIGNTVQATWPIQALLVKAIKTA